MDERLLLFEDHTLLKSLIKRDNAIPKEVEIELTLRIKCVYLTEKKEFQIFINAITKHETNLHIDVVLAGKYLYRSDDPFNEEAILDYSVHNIFSQMFSVIGFYINSNLPNFGIYNPKLPIFDINDIDRSELNILIVEE